MKSVIVTGASRGVGEACAKLFAAHGWAVCVNCVSRRDAADEAVRQIAASGGEAFVCQADVSDPADAKRLADETLARYGRIDALVNNAALSHIGLFGDDPEAEKRLIDVDFIGPMNCARAVLPHMLREHAGAIVNVSSMWGQVGASCEVVYSAAKAGLIGFTKALAKEVAPSGIRVNCVSPGVIDTEMNAHLTEDDRQALIDEIPMCRFGSPNEVAECICFLCEKAAYVTGQVLGVNGGLIC